MLKTYASNFPNVGGKTLQRWISLEGDGKTVPINTTHIEIGKKSRTPYVELNCNVLKSPSGT